MTAEKTYTESAAPTAEGLPIIDRCGACGWCSGANTCAHPQAPDIAGVRPSAAPPSFCPLRRSR